MELHHMSEEDANIIADKVLDKLESKLYLNVGSGLVSLLWRGLLLGIIALAAYGAGVKHWF